jgi:hypothetical protein
MKNGFEMSLLGEMSLFLGLQICQITKEFLFLKLSISEKL